MITTAFRSLLLALVLWAPALVTATAAESGSGSTPLPIVDPTTGNPSGATSGDVQADLERVGTAIQGLTSDIGGQEGLYGPLTNKNAELLAEKVHARDRSSVGQIQGPGIAFGGLGLQFGGEAIDIDSRYSYYSAPTIYQFIGQGKNHLASLDGRMQRATKWLNKHTCGGFDWTAQFTSMFRREVLVDYVKSLGEGVVAAAPMALLGAFAPQLAEIVKWLKLTVGFDLTAVKADCNSMQQTLTHGIRSAAWSETYADCMARFTDAREAVRQCNNPETTGGLARSDGTRTNPTTSQAAATGGNWETNGYNMASDWLGGLFQNGNQMGATANTAATNGSTTGQAQAQEEGTANAATGAVSNAIATILGRGRDPAMNRYAQALFGEIQVAGTGALEIGRKRFNLFRLQLENEAAAMQNSLEAQLAIHYGLLVNLNGNTTALSESYRKIKLWTYHVRGSDSGMPPWQSDPAIMGKLQTLNRYGGTERFDDRTVDACAYLLTSLNDQRGNPQNYAAIENEWEVKMFLAMVCKYEFLLYVSDEMKGIKEQLDAISEKVTSSGNTTDKHLLDVKREQFSAAMRDLQDAVTQVGFYVASRLPKINSYRVPSVGQYAPSRPSNPTWMQQPVLGR